MLSLALQSCGLHFHVECILRMKPHTETNLALYGVSSALHSFSSSLFFLFIILFAFGVGISAYPGDSHFSNRKCYPAPQLLWSGLENWRLGGTRRATLKTGSCTIAHHSWWSLARGCTSEEGCVYPAKTKTNYEWQLGFLVFPRSGFGQQLYC